MHYSGSSSTKVPLIFEFPETANINKRCVRLANISVGLKSLESFSLDDSVEFTAEKKTEGITGVFIFSLITSLRQFPHCDCTSRCGIFSRCFVFPLHACVDWMRQHGTPCSGHWLFHSFSAPGRSSWRRFHDTSSAILLSLYFLHHWSFCIIQPLY